MKKSKDIEFIGDIKSLVDAFYDKVRQDELLGPVFEERIQGNWPAHLAIMYRFWGTVLIGQKSYFGSPFLKHANLPVSKEHFNHWLALFNETLDELYQGPKTEEAKFRAEKMAEMFQYKIDYLRQTGNTPLK